MKYFIFLTMTLFSQVALAAAVCEGDDEDTYLSCVVEIGEFCKTQTDYSNNQCFEKANNACDNYLSSSCVVHLASYCNEITDLSRNQCFEKGVNNCSGEAH